MVLAAMRIGVLADTHIPDALPELPARVLQVFNGVDLIFHAGDICDLSVLQQLEPIAQTFAVYGDRDKARVQHYLQERQCIEFSNRRVGLVHGHRAWQGDWMTRLAFRLNATARAEALYAYALSAFPGVDAVIFGHSHAPYIRMHGGVLLFNPGSLLPRNGQPGTIGILEVGTHAIKGRILAI